MVFIGNKQVSMQRELNILIDLYDKGAICKKYFLALKKYIFSKYVDLVVKKPVCICTKCIDFLQDALMRLSYYQPMRNSIKLEWEEGKSQGDFDLFIASFNYWFTKLKKVEKLNVVGKIFKSVEDIKFEE